MKNATWLKVAKTAILILALCALSASVVLAGPTRIPEQSEEYKKGQALEDEEKYAEARAIYEAGAEKGDPWCMSGLGEYYLMRGGARQKDEARGMELENKAIELINRAVELNCPRAFYVLGVCYCVGSHGFPEDTQKGIELITKAGEMNYSPAFFWLGLWSLDGGMGIPQDPQKGVEILKRAAEMNDPDANDLLGNLYRSGTYVEQDDRIALAYFKKAKRLGFNKLSIDDAINKLEQRLAE